MEKSTPAFGPYCKAGWKCKPGDGNLTEKLISSFCPIKHLRASKGFQIPYEVVIYIGTKTENKTPTFRPESAVTLPKGDQVSLILVRMVGGRRPTCVSLRGF